MIYKSEHIAVCTSIIITSTPKSKKNQLICGYYRWTYRADL